MISSLREDLEPSTPTLLLVPCVLLASLAACAPGSAEPDDPPRLAVVVVVDQMMPGYLEEYSEHFTGGLRRLLDEGAIFTDARLAHAVPHTAPGYATVATGRHPSSHGIVGNYWWSVEEDRRVYAAGDTAYRVWGDPPARGRSPRSLLGPTLGDLLRERSPDSRVFSVAGKDRSAILTAGHSADAAYWFHVDQARFVSTSYYRNSADAWVEAFNTGPLPDSLAGVAWTPLEGRDLGHPDDRPGESGIRGGEVTLPYPPAEEAGENEGLALLLSPYADELIFRFAERLVEVEGLGGDSIPDILWIGASSSDYIGHQYGPGSAEVAQYYLHLDRQLGRFMAALDERLGRDGYVLALTSDHGVQPLPEQMEQRGADAGRIHPDTLSRWVGGAVEAAARELGVEPPGWERLYLGIHLDVPETMDAETTGRLRRRAAELLAEASSVIADAVPSDAVAGADPAGLDGYLAAYARSHHPPRSPDIWIRPVEGWLLSSSGAGTAHLTPYAFDQRIPLVFYGAGIRPGRYGGDAGQVSVAPTLADFLGLDTDGYDGTSLRSAFR